MDRVLLIHSGVAESWTQMHDGQKDNVWLYTGRGAADGTDEEAGNAAVARAARLGYRPTAARRDGGTPLAVALSPYCVVITILKTSSRTRPLHQSTL